MAGTEEHGDSKAGDHVAKWTFIWTVLGAVGFVAAVFLFVL